MRGVPFSSTTFLHQGCPLKPHVKIASTTFLQNESLVGDMRGEPVRLPPSLSEPPASPPRIPLTDRVDSTEEGCGAVQYCNKRVFPVAPASTVRLRQIAFCEGSTTRNLQVKATTPGFLETACKNCSMTFLQSSSSGGKPESRDCIFSVNHCRCNWDLPGQIRENTILL